MRILIPIGGGFCLSQGLVVTLGIASKAAGPMILVGAVLVLVGHFGGLYEDNKRYKALLKKLENGEPTRIEVRPN